MSIKRYELDSGKVRYRVWIKSHGRTVATRVFERKSDAVAWEQEQSRRLRQGDWIDPRRGKVSLREVAEAWMASRATMKQRTRDTDEGYWRRYIEPAFGNRSVISVTEAEVREWMGALASKHGLSPSTVSRALATLRGVFGHAVADNRIRVNVAARVKPSKRRRKREPRFLNMDELHRLADATGEAGRDVVLFLGLTGLRWSEMAAVQVGDLVQVPGPGVRVQRAMTAKRGGGALVVDEVKNYQARTVPLVAELQSIVERLAAGKSRDELLFMSPNRQPLRESNWRRTVRWSQVIRELGLAPLRIHDLRHTAASAWIAAGADVKVVQRILGHSTGTMTLDLYGHLWDASLWEAAKLLGHISVTREVESQDSDGNGETSHDR